MATASPTIVAIRASAMPGATTARVADPLTPMLAKASMIPQTVPNSPKNGLIFPVVAKKTSALSSRLISSAPVLSNVILITPSFSLWATGSASNCNEPAAPECGFPVPLDRSVSSLYPASSILDRGVRLMLTQDR